MGGSINATLETNVAPAWPSVAPIADSYASVKRAMAALPGAEREVLMLWNGGMDYREIAERTMQSSDAVGLLLTQARKRLVMAYDVLGVGAKEPSRRGPWWSPWLASAVTPRQSSNSLPVPLPLMLEPSS